MSETPQRTEDMMPKNTYRVRLVHEHLERRMPMEFVGILAENCQEAISKAIRRVRDEGWVGTIRWPEAENQFDGHDAFKSPW